MGPKTILICSNYAWTVYNFRLPLLRSLKNNGYKIITLTQFDGYQNYLNKYSDIILPLNISRMGLNPFKEFITIINILYVLFRYRPFCVLPFTLKPVLYCSLISKILAINCIPMITGLGTAFLASDKLKCFIIILYKLFLDKVSFIIFQNKDDYRLFLKNKIVKADVCKVSPGSGIDCDFFKYRQLSDDDKQPFRFLLIARLIADKGIREFIDASKMLHEEFPCIEFNLIGPSRVQNHSSIRDSELKRWKDEGVINYFGEVEDVQQEIAEASCIVLPSYREGTSRVLLEASAIGRPIIATNVTGCREIVLDEKSGFLCEVKNSHDLYLKMKKMYLLDQGKRNEMGLIGRKHVENKFNHELVCQIYLDSLSSL